MSGSTKVSRTSIQLYRDCMRLAKHIGGTVRSLSFVSPLERLRIENLTPMCIYEQSKKGSAIKSLIRREFEKARDETDPEKIEGLKTKCATQMAFGVVFAIRGLSNYLVLANSSKDKQLQNAMKTQQPEAAAPSGPAQAEYREL